MANELLVQRNIEEVLEKTTIHQLLDSGKRIVSIPNGATIREALEILSNNRIISAPVQAGEGHSFLGFVDASDIVTYALKMYSKDKELENGVKFHSWIQDLSELEIKGKEFSSHRVKDVIDMSKRNPFCGIEASCSVAKLLLLFRKGIHRALVTEGHRVIGVVSQSTVVQFLARNIAHYGLISQTAIEDLGLGIKKQLLSVQADSRALNAFHMMEEYGVSAVAVVDREGVLLANVSASDLRGLNEDNFGSLLKPVLEFLKEVVYKGPISPPVTVLPKTTFETVILKLAATRVHRLWMVDSMESLKLKGIVSLTDVMNLLDLRVYVSHEST